MNDEPILLDLGPRRPLVQPGVWLARCVDCRPFTYRAEDRLEFMWALDAGPYDLDLKPCWERGSKGGDIVNYDDPTEALLPLYYSVLRRNGRWAAVGDKYSQDMWRLCNKPPRTDRMPTRSIVRSEAFVRVRTVVLDYRKEERQEYSVVDSIVKPSTASLSKDDLKIVGPRRS